MLHVHVQIIAFHPHRLLREKHMLCTLVGVGKGTHDIDPPVLQLLKQRRPVILHIDVIPARVGRHRLLVLIAIATATTIRIRDVVGILVPGCLDVYIHIGSTRISERTQRKQQRKKEKVCSRSSYPEEIPAGILSEKRIQIRNKPILSVSGLISILLRSVHNSPPYTACGVFLHRSSHYSILDRFRGILFKNIVKQGPGGPCLLYSPNFCFASIAIISEASSTSKTELSRMMFR